MFAGRIKLDSTDDAIGLLSQSGLSETALLAAAEHKIISGLPETVTPAKVKHYFKYVGKDIDQLEAEIARALL